PYVLSSVNCRLSLHDALPIYISGDDRAITEAYKALIPGGGFLVAVPQHPILWSQTDIVARHVRRYHRGELENKLRAAHFEILFSDRKSTRLNSSHEWISYAVF